MTAVDPVFAQWLMAEGDWTVIDAATLLARWGAGGVTSQRATTLATKADAEAEAARQLAFLGGPLVEDEHLLVGAYADAIGTVITVTGPSLGYETGVDVFVIGARDDRAAGTSTVTVLRRL